METIAVDAVSNVFYFVADLAGASAWYRQLLGAEPRTTMPQLVEFDVGGSVLTLHANDEFNAGGAGVGTVAYWTTPDVTVRWRSAWPEEGPCTAAPRPSSPATGCARSSTRSATCSGCGSRPPSRRHDHEPRPDPGNGPVRRRGHRAGPYDHVQAARPRRGRQR